MRSIASLLCGAFIIVLLNSTKTWTLTLIIPGLGCGVTKEIRSLGEDEQVPDEIEDLAALECVLVRNLAQYDDILAKVERARCMTRDVGACSHVKGHTFLPGNVTCTPEMVQLIDTVPENLAEVRCSLLPDFVITELAKNQETAKILCLNHGLNCHMITGYTYLAKTIACGRSLTVALLDTVPSDWQDVDCALMTNELYAMEEVNIKIQLCKERKSKCSNLPTGYVYIPGPDCVSGSPIELMDVAPDSFAEPVQCTIMTAEVYEQYQQTDPVADCQQDENLCANLPPGYGYESGPDCGAGTPIELVETAPAELDLDFSCKIMTPEVFSELQDELTIKHCREAGDCDQLCIDILSDKQEWGTFTTGEFRPEEETWRQFKAVDNHISGTWKYYYHSPENEENHFLQVTLPQVHFVTRIVVQARMDAHPERNTFFEARVGLQDAAGLSRQQLSVNKICFKEGNLQTTNKDHPCPYPLKGRHITVQRTDSQDGNHVLAINEIDVHAAVLTESKFVAGQKNPDKASWQVFATSVWEDNDDNWGAQYAIDGIISAEHTLYFHGTYGKGHRLQVDLMRAYVVTRLAVETRLTSCTACVERRTFYEARVGNVDTSGLGLQLLTVNEICFKEYESTSTTKDHPCAHPVLGRFVTVQRTGTTPTDNDSYVLTVNEIDVYATTP